MFPYSEWLYSIRSPVELNRIITNKEVIIEKITLENFCRDNFIILKLNWLMND